MCPCTQAFSTQRLSLAVLTRGKAWELPRAVTYLDIGWTCGAVAIPSVQLVRWLSGPKKRHQDLTSTVESLHGPWVAIGSALTYVRFFQAFPHVITYCK